MAWATKYQKAGKQMKKVWALVLAAMLALSLAACSVRVKDAAAATTALMTTTAVSTAVKLISDEFVNIWEYEKSVAIPFIVIYDDGTYCLADEAGDVIFECTYEMQSDCLRLLENDGSMYLELSFAADGRLMDSEGNYLFASTLPDQVEPQPSPHELEEYLGTWQYIGSGKLVRFEEDGYWTIHTEEGDDYGNYEYDGSGIRANDVLGEFDQYYLLDEDGNLTDNDGNILEWVAETAPIWFDEHGLFANYTMDQGTVTLDHGGAYYNNTGDEYILCPVEWEVIKDSDNNTQDGYREMEFTAICYFNSEDNPNFSGEIWNSCNSELYDRYTGFWLPAFSTYHDTERGENYYHYTIDSDGYNYEIEYNFSTEWKEAGDYYSVLYKSYFVRIPENYDGLMFCMQPECASYSLKKRAEGQENAVTSFITAEDVVGFDMENTLICNIN